MGLFLRYLIVHKSTRELFSDVFFVCLIFVFEELEQS